MAVLPGVVFRRSGRAENALHVIPETFDLPFKAVFPTYALFHFGQFSPHTGQFIEKLRFCRSLFFRVFPSFHFSPGWTIF